MTKSLSGVDKLLDSPVKSIVNDTNPNQFT